MTGTKLSTIGGERFSDRMSGPHLRGLWRFTAVTLWSFIWLICLVVMLLSAYHWYKWDSLPVEEWNRVFHYTPVTSSEQAEKIIFQEETLKLGLSLGFYGGLFFVMRLVAGLPFFVLSFLIILHRNDRLMVLFFAILLAVIGAAGRFLSSNWSILYEFVGFTGRLTDQQMSIVNVVIVDLDAFLDLSVVLLFLFPDGRFVPRWSRWLALVALLDAVFRNLLGNTPLSLEGFYLWLNSHFMPLPVQVIFIFGLFAMFYRYLRVADPVQKQQIKWFLLGMGLLVPFYLAHFLFYNSSILYGWTGTWTYRQWLILQMVLEPGWYVMQGMLAVCIAIALLRYHLWDIKIILNRSLVYATLSIAVIVLYGLSVGILGALFQTRSNPLISISATGLVAVAIQPLHQQVQRMVNRMMYGEWDDPYRVLTRLANALEGTPSTDQVLPSLASAIAQALKIPFVSIQLEEGGGANQVVTFGQPVEDCITYPLVYQKEVIGLLQVARRFPGEGFSSADSRLLENISRQAGSAVQAVRLNAELVRSRVKIVSAREEERRRLRRDLHDGLGPILASQSLKMAAVRQIITEQPGKAEVMVDDVIRQNENTISEVRRLVYGLRPPSLDALGLAGAVRDLALQSGREDLTGNGMGITIDDPESGLPALSAAVEVNAYRITQEALTNAARHARAKHISIRFRIDYDPLSAQCLVIIITDDGVGIPTNFQAGVGLRSMRERAEELGGKLHIEQVEPHGTRITCWLPMMGSEEER